MPLLAFTVGLHTATPLVAFVALTTGIVIGLANHSKIDLRAARQLLVASLVGIPAGLVLLQTAPEHTIKALLGAVLIAFGAYSLYNPRSLSVHRPHWAYLFGFLGGVLGGAYNTNGPPVVLYGTLRRWPPDRFRATLQGYFVPASIVIWTSHGLAGLWTNRVLHLYVEALPLIAVAIVLGSYFNRRIPHARFERGLYGVLIALGVLLLV